MLKKWSNFKLTWWIQLQTDFYWTELILIDIWRDEVKGWRHKSYVYSILSMKLSTNQFLLNIVFILIILMWKTTKFNPSRDGALLPSIATGKSELLCRVSYLFRYKKLTYAVCKCTRGLSHKSYCHPHP